MTMDCAWFRETVLDYADGELSRLDLFAFQRHFAGCPECSELLRTVEGQAALLTALSRPVPPRNLGERIDRAVDDRVALRRRPLPGARWIAAAAAALLLALGWTRLRPAPEPAPAAPALRLRIVDVELPTDKAMLGRMAPSYENPGASVQDYLVSGATR